MHHLAWHSKHMSLSMVLLVYQVLILSMVLQRFMSIMWDMLAVWLLQLVHSHANSVALSLNNWGQVWNNLPSFSLVIVNSWRIRDFIINLDLIYLERASEIGCVVKTSESLLWPNKPIMSKHLLMVREIAIANSNLVDLIIIFSTLRKIFSHLRHMREWLLTRISLSKHEIILSRDIHTPSTSILRADSSLKS